MKCENKMKKALEKRGEIEQDGSCGWLVVFAAFMTHLITHGIVYSYGILFLAFEDVFGTSKAAIAWIASITTGSLYLSGPFASTFLRRHGSRLVALTGTILSSAGCFATMFTPNLYFMYVSLGFLTGVGYGLIFIPAVVEVTLYFKKYRAFACGVAVSGAGGGAFVFSPLIEYLLDMYGWRGTLLICTALLLNCIPCALIFRNKFSTEEATRISKLENAQDNEYSHEEKNNAQKDDDTGEADVFLERYVEKEVTKERKQQKMEIVIGKCDAFDTAFEVLDDPKPTEKFIKQPNNEKGNKANSKITKHNCFYVSNLTLFKIFQQKEMILFYSAQTLFFFGFYFPFIGIPGMAVQYGIGESKSVWIISTIGISTVIGRVVLGYMADRTFINSIILYKVALLTSGLSTAMVPLLSSFELLIIYAIIFGLSTAVMLSQTTVVLVEVVGIERMADAMGLNNMFCGIGALIGPPALGVLYDHSGSYTPSFVVSGTGIAFGGVLLFLMSCCPKHQLSFA